MSDLAELAEFLRERIADDKADALAEIAAGYNGYADPGWDSDRVLAECEVKLLIVELVQGSLAEIVHTAIGCSETTDPGDAEVGDKILRLLTSLYADHHDYDESWRP